MSRGTDRDETTTGVDGGADRSSGPSYPDAVTELESILTEIEGDSVDVDELSRQVRRAAELIRLCQDRIEGARVEVERVVADLRAPDPATSDDRDD